MIDKIAKTEAAKRTTQRAWLTAAIQKGLDSGPARPINTDDVIRRGRTRLAARKRGAK